MDDRLHDDGKGNLKTLEELADELLAENRKPEGKQMSLTEYVAKTIGTLREDNPESADVFEDELKRHSTRLYLEAKKLRGEYTGDIEDASEELLKDDPRIPDFDM